MLKQGAPKWDSADQAVFSEPVLRNLACTALQVSQLLYVINVAQQQAAASTTETEVISCKND